MEALKYNNGRASVIQVCKYIWENYENDLRKSDVLFFTWQYRIRWAATQLRKSGEMKSAMLSPRGIWEIA